MRTDSTEVPRRALWAAIAAGTLLSLVVSIRIAAGAFVLGSPAGGWVYQYLYPFQFRAMAIAAVVLACCLVPVMVPLERIRDREWRILTLWLAVGLCSQGVVRALTPHTMEAMFLGDGSNGFYQPTLKYSGRQLLGDFNRLRLELPEHPRTNMPGKLMLIYALELVTSRPAALAWLVVLVSDLGGLLLYLFVRDLLHDRETALLSFVLYLFVPARVLLFPVLNTVTPVLALLCAWLWARLLRSRNMAFAFALGAAAYGVIFYEPTPAVMGLLFLILTASAIWHGVTDVRTAAVAAGVIIAGFVATYGLMRALLGFDLLSAMRAVAADAVEFNTRVNRPYSRWVGQNLIDLAFGSGWMQAVLAAWAVAWMLRPSTWRAGGTAAPFAAFCAGLAATIFATDLAGINRGEVVRLWVFLACFLQVPAAYVCARLNSRVAVALVIGTTLLQNALSTSMIAFATP